MRKRTLKSIVVAGPTASGKSALAALIAREFGGVVVNADSMQVYRGMPILTACPDREQRAAAPHLLYEVLAPDDPCSVGRWLDMARKTAEGIFAEGKIPVFAGGAGLYLQALAKGLAPAPEIPDAVRDEARRLLADLGNEAFHRRLAKIDPRMAAELDPSNSQRLARAWEVMEASGKSLAEWREEPHQGRLEADFHRILLAPDPASARIAADGRFRAMVEAGALEEARAMAALDLDPALPATRVLGLDQLIRHLRGEIDLERAIELSTIATHQYAKRQRTWFRHRFEADRACFTQLSESVVEENFSFIRQFLLTADV